jgi:hypothetical protein
MDQAPGRSWVHCDPISGRAFVNIVLTLAFGLRNPDSSTGRRAAGGGGTNEGADGQDGLTPGPREGRIPEDECAEESDPGAAEASAPAAEVRRGGERLLGPAQSYRSRSVGIGARREGLRRDRRPGGAQAPGHAPRRASATSEVQAGRPAHVFRSRTTTLGMTS